MSAGRRRRPLLLTLGGAVILLQAVLVAALALAGAAEVRRIERVDRLAELDRIATLVGPGLAALEDEAALRQRVAGAGAATGVRITVIDAQGRVLADSLRDPADMDNHRYRPEVAAALAEGHGWSERRSRTLDRPMLYTARRHRDTSGRDRIIRVAHPRGAAGSAVAALTRTIAAMGLASVVVTALMVALLSRRLAGTLRALAGEARRFASGDLRHRLPEPGIEELAQLCLALNDMARVLDEQMELLRGQRNQQQAILHSMSNGVLALDLEQRVLAMNRAAEQLLAQSGERARGRLLQEVLRDPPLIGFVQAALESPRRSAELALERDGVHRVQAVSETLRDARGEPAGVLIILNDVTELRRLESIRSDFAANVSHELRTPITNIKGYVETMLEMDAAGPDADQLRRFLGVVKANADRLAAIVEDILALTRLEQPRAQDSLERECAPVERLLQAVAAQFEPAAAAKRITLANAAPSGLGVLVHRHLAEQAVGNLLSNAINYSPGETTVTLSAAPAPDGLVRISVADQGPGIAREHLTRIFERFYRVDRARSRALGGTGLGLAIVKHVALVHGGRVEVESEPGRGSTFHLFLPGSGPEASGAAEPDHRPAVPGEAGPDSRGRSAEGREDPA
jgi:two-component system phosphate regulon sensor histidine kinase PhoR